MKYRNASEIFPDELLKEIRSKRKEGTSIQELAKEYELSNDTIRRILYK